MRPEQTFEFTLNFASRLSPLWLLLVLPAALVPAYWLYRREIGAMPARRRHLLYALRLGLVAAVCFAMFMPELGIVRRLLYRGRIVFLLDNSESMLANDSSMPPLDAMAAARVLLLDEDADSAVAAFQRCAARLQEALNRLKAFQRDLEHFGRESVETAQAAQQLADRMTIVFLALAQEEKRLPVERLTDEQREELRRHWAESIRLKEEFDDLFAGAAPAAQAVSRLGALFETASAAFRAFQLDIDRQELATENKAFRAATAAIIAQRRLDLVPGIVNRLLPTIRQWVPGQVIQLVGLMDGASRILDRNDVMPPQAAVRGPTDILGRLKQLIDEEHDFPLSAVVLLSDGVDLSRHDADAVLKTSVRQRVPLFCAGVGHVQAPFDMAIERLSVPPVGVLNQPLAVGVHVKAAVPLPTPCTISVRADDGQELASQTVEVRNPHQIVYLPMTPTRLGPERLRVSLHTAGPDLFTAHNNHAEFVLDVRDRPVRVLLLDDRPHWQTRFALNILSRLPYVDLNRIIRITSPDGTVKRGVDNGMWPDSAAALNIYDLIVLGRFDDDILTAEEWAQIDAFLTVEGKALAILAPGSAPHYPEALVRRFPFRPLAAAGVSASGPGSAVDRRGALLRMTDEGTLHPLTRGLADNVAGDGFPGASLAPDAFALLFQAGATQPLVSCRFVGDGRVFLLADDQLWRHLNQHALAAHAALFGNLVTWALRTFDQGVAVDQNVLTEGESFQVWFAAAGVEASVVDAAGKALARAHSEPANAANGLARARFEPLPPGRYRLHAGPARQAEPLHVLKDDRELMRLALDRDYLTRLAVLSGGEYRALSEIDHAFAGIPLKERREIRRHVFAFWSSRITLLALLLMLSAEWTMRKMWRLV